MSSVRCSGCSRFRSEEDVVEMAGDSVDHWPPPVWTECVYCMSESDLNFYGLKRKFKAPSEGEANKGE